MSKRRKVSVDVLAPEKGEIAPFVGYYANANPHTAGAEVPEFELYEHHMSERVQRHVVVGRQVSQLTSMPPTISIDTVSFAIQCRGTPMLAEFPTHIGRMLAAGHAGLRGQGLRQGRGRASELQVRPGHVQQGDGQAAGEGLARGTDDAGCTCCTATSCLAGTHLARVMPPGPALQQHMSST
jgi:hypothetical protein